MYKLLLLVAMVAISGNTFAQEVFKGKVTDAETGLPIEGVQIRFEGSKFKVQSANNGTFSIEKTGNTRIIAFSHEDYDKAIIKTIKGDNEIAIMLNSNVRYNQYGQKVSRKSLDSESRNGFITWESKDGEYRLWMDNRVYLDGAQYFDNYDNDLSYDENKALGQLDIPSQLLKLRRMRLAIKAKVSKNWYGEIDFDFDGNIVDIKDAYIRRYLGDWGQLRVGQFRMPQGMQQTTTSRYLKLMERASVYEFNPNRRLGIGYSSWSNKYMFGLGLHTEEIRNEHDQLEGDADYDKGEMQGATPMLGVSSRAAYYVFNEPGKLLSIGGGFSTRTPGLYKYPDNRTKYDPKDETTVSGMEFVVAKVNGIDLTTNMNIDLALSYKSWRMTGEYYYNTMSMEDGSDAVNFSGFYIQSAYLLTGEFHPWNHREAEFTGIRPNSKKGALEVAARFSHIDLNDFDAGIYGGAKDQYTVGLNYYITGNVKVMLNYSYVDHDRYADGDGDYADYVNTYKPAGQGGYDYGMLQWRLEIDF